MSAPLPGRKTRLPRWLYGPLRTLLVVDEESEPRLRKMLAAAPMRTVVQVEHDPARALERLSAGEADAAVVGENVGPGGGLEFMRTFRARGGRAPLLLIADVRAPGREEEAFAAGAADVLYPDELNPALLAHALRQAGRQADTEARLRGNEARLRYATSHDHLTGLGNRTRILDRTARALAEQGDGGVALLFVDLDRFKILNDSLGHGVGDEILRLVGERLHALAPGGSEIARLGGDEFVVLYHGYASPRAPVRLAQNLLEAVRMPLPLKGGGEAVLSCSIGVALGEGEESPEVLLRSADIAMALVKRSGGDAYRVFHGGMQQQVRSEMQLEQGLRRALERGGLELMVQPIVSLPRSMPWGFEALVRWRDEEGRQHPPQEFLPMAERTGLIVPIGEWVLREACRWCVGVPSAVSVTVNLSIRQLLQPEFEAQVWSALEGSGLAPQRLCLEVTESMLAEEPEVVSATLSRLRAQGVRVLLDDFGTGYSSLNQLLTYPIDGLKIDKSFVDRLEEQPRFLEVIRAVLVMAGNLDMEVIVEGVETSAQRRVIESLDSELVQGHLFARPMYLRDTGAYLRATARR